MLEHQALLWRTPGQRIHRLLVGKELELHHLTLDGDRCSLALMTFLFALILTQLESGLNKIPDLLGEVLSNHPDFPSFDPDKINPEVTIQELSTMSSGLLEYSENRKGVGEILKTLVEAVWQHKVSAVISPNFFMYPILASLSNPSYFESLSILNP